VNGGETKVQVNNGIVTLRGKATSAAQKDLTTEYANEPFNERVRTPMSERGKNREKLESLLDKWNAEFDKLEAKIRASADPKVYYDEQITVLRQHNHNAKN
jgi:hypothetical protein